MVDDPPSERSPRVIDAPPARAHVPLTPTEAEDHHDRLLRDLARLEELLAAHEPTGYPAAWARRVRRDVAAGDAGGLDRLLRAYAGAGSFSDLVLRDGPTDEVDALRSRIWADASALRDDLRHG